MPNYCAYHPVQPAKWRCQNCHHQFCKQCAPDANEARQMGRCSRCGKNLAFLGMATHTQPFWHRLSAFFLYPLSPNALAIIALCTILPFFFPENISGAIASLILTACLIKYTYSVIEYTAEGHMSPPQISVAFSGGLSLLVQQIAIFVVAGLFVAACQFLGGDVLATVGIGFSLFCLPASIILLALSQSITTAINPLRLINLTATIGWPYIVLYGHLILMVFALSTIQELLFTHLSWSLASVGSGFSGSYFMLILFHMMGYLLFQYQDRLGFAANLDLDRDQDQAPPPDKQQVIGAKQDADIDIALKDGRYDLVISLLTADLKKQPEHTLRRQQLFLILWELQDRPNLEAFAPSFLKLFVSNHESFRLIQLLEYLLADKSVFRINDPTLLLGVCEILYQQGRYAMIFNLCKDLHKRIPGDPMLADIYVLIAKSLANGLQQWDKALQYLGYIDKNFPHHPIKAHITTYITQAQQHKRLDVGFA